MQQQANPIQKITELPKRPARSQNVKTITQPIALVSNHFAIEFIDGKQQINVYAIDFEPQIENDNRTLKDDVMRSAKAEIVNQGLKDYNIRGRNIWSDFRVDQRIIAKGVDPISKKEYTVKVEFVREHNISEISGDNQNQKVLNPVVQSVNVSIKRALKELGMIEIGRLSKFYDPKSIDRNRLPDHGLKVWRGVKTSFQCYQGKPFIQIDFASRVLREETCLQFLDNLKQNSRMNLEDIKQQAIGLSVLAAYGNYRIYRIDDIDYKLNPSTKFQLNDGKQISFAEYYKTRYNINITKLQQPLIVYRDKRNPEKITHLIPELLTMTGLTDRQRADFRCMQAVAEFTKLTPDQRNNEILTMQNRLAKALQKRNITLKADQNLQGHMLIAPTIRMNNKDLRTDQTAFFIIKDTVYKQSHIKDWFLVYAGRGKRDDEDADFLVNELKKAGERIGIKMEKPYFVVMNDTNPQNWTKEIANEIDKGGQPQMIVTFIPERDKERLYTGMKKFCFQEKGISHQNVLLKFLKNKNPASVASKIAQQMSVKLGFPLWAIPRPKGVSDKTMVIGIDIYHKLVAQKKSCMGFVAHMDADCQNTFSKPIIMREGQEMCHEIGKATIEAIQAYFERNGKKYLPDTIIVYRDGVGTGQIQALMNTEISQIKSAIKSVSADYTPKFAALMINKKINDRFFANNNNLPQGVQRSKQGQFANPPSGTVVADKITSHNFDFFLAAQNVTQGTCTPTHFTVLDNTTDWPEELFWQMTYFQCFNYQNWSGAVRVPACVQYAHKLAYLIGDTYQGSIHKNLEKLQCYL